MCFLANVGQEEPWEEVEKKALKIGALKMVIVDLQKEFVEELCFRAIQCNVSQVPSAKLHITSRVSTTKIPPEHNFSDMILSSLKFFPLEFITRVMLTVLSLEGYL